MDPQELADEIKATEDIIEVRKYRHRKEMHELKRDLKKLRRQLVKETGETATVVAAEAEPEKASIDE